jgi:hypothetical protein
MIDLVYDCLVSVGAAPKRRTRAPLSLIKMNSTPLPGGSLVSLLFMGDEPHPRFVVRLPRDPRLDDRVRANYQTLLTLQKSPALHGTVPEPIFAGRVRGALLTIETCLHGSQMAREMLNARRAGNAVEELGLLSAGWNWLAILHRSTRRELPAGFAGSRRIQLQIQTDFLHAQGVLSREEVCCLRRAVEGLLNLPFPYSRCHADFNPNNALRPFDNADGLYGFDFEFGRNAGCLMDVFEWARSGWLCLPGTPNLTQEETCARLEALWSHAHPTGQRFHAALRNYAAEMKVTSDDLRPLWVGYLAVSLAAKLQSPLGSQSPDLPTWRNALHYELQGLP